MLFNLIKIIILLLSLALSNCSAANFWNLYNPSNNTNPTPEYNNPYFLLIRGGFFFHLNNMPGPVGNNVASKYSGTRCTHSVLFLVSIGDSSLESAMKEAKIEKIATVSYEHLGVLFSLYHRFCTTVSGE